MHSWRRWSRVSKISIVVPVYYNADTLELLYNDMKEKILGQLGA